MCTGYQESDGEREELEDSMNSLAKDNKLWTTLSVLLSSLLDESKKNRIAGSAIEFQDADLIVLY